MRLSPGLVEIADLGRDVGLEEAVADDQQKQAEEEQVRHDQHEFGDRHDDATDDHGGTLSQPAVGDDAAEERSQIHKRRVRTIDHR